jgi:hypothetical protein
MIASGRHLLGSVPPHGVNAPVPPRVGSFGGTTTFTPGTALARVVAPAPDAPVAVVEVAVPPLNVSRTTGRVTRRIGDLGAGVVLGVPGVVLEVLDVEGVFPGERGMRGMRDLQ